VFALFWLLIVIRFDLIAIGPVFILFYAIIGAAGAGELNPEYDYADYYVVDDYPTTGSCPTDSEYLLWRASRCTRCMCWDWNSGSWREWGKTSRRRSFGYFGGGELETTDLGSGMGMHSSVYPLFYGFRSTGVGVLLTLGGHELTLV
jgi:hypothetical protein